MTLTHRFRTLALGIGTAVLAGALTACDANDNPPCGGPEGPQFSAADVCELPPPDCEDCASIWGDPHLITFDGRKYNMMTVGEFTGVTTPATEFQFRFAPFGSSRSVSVLSAVAVSYADTTVTVTLTPPELSEAVVRLDGEVITPSTTGVFPQGGAVGLGPGGEIIVASPDGSKAVVRTFGLRLEVDIDAVGDPSGLMGDRDGEVRNDFTTRDGRNLGPDPDVDVIHGDFADSWRLDDETSRLWYGDGESTATFTDLDFPYQPLTLDDLDPQLRAASEQTCREAGVTDPELLDACVLDVSVTGDPSYATSAAALQARRGLGSGPGSDSSLNPDALVSWVAEPSGLEALSTPVLSTSGDAVYLVGLDSQRVATVVALDGRTGEERWRRAGVAALCGVTDLGNGTVLVVGDAAGALAVGDLPSVVILDAASGTVLESTAWERRPNLIYCAPPVVVGDRVVIPNVLGELTAWTFDGKPTLAWHRDRLDKLGGDLVVVDGFVVATKRGSEGAYEVVQFDAADGSTNATVPIEGTGYPNGRYLVRVGDVAVISLTGVVSGISLADTKPATLWEIDLKASGYGGSYSAISGDAQNAYGHIDDKILALNAETGRVVWELSEAGWRSSKASAPAIDGSVFDTTFNRAALLQARDGELVREYSVEQLFGSGSGVGTPDRLELVPGGGLLYVAERDDQLLIARIDVN